MLQKHRRVEEMLFTKALEYNIFLMQLIFSLKTAAQLFNFRKQDFGAQFR